MRFSAALFCDGREIFHTLIQLGRSDSLDSSVLLLMLGRRPCVPTNFRADLTVNKLV